MLSTDKFIILNMPIKQDPGRIIEFFTAKFLLTLNLSTTQIEFVIDEFTRALPATTTEFLNTFHKP